jgi:N-acetyl-beta-hexosaminidase
MQGLPGFFSLNPKVKINSSPAFADVAQLWSEQTFGKALTVAPLPGSSVPTAQVVFEQKKNTSDTEGYQLRITPNRIHLIATTVAGAQRGVQTLLQLAELQPESKQLPGLAAGNQEVPGPHAAARGQLLPARNGAGNFGQLPAHRTHRPDRVPVGAVPAQHPLYARWH